MIKTIQKNLIRFLTTVGGLMVLAGCDTTANLASFLDPSTVSTDLTAFFQQFAREALAAFLL